MDSRKILISGGGIAGLTLAIRLREIGWQPLVIEREPALRTAGYMMDFFGTGWDVAERMGLTDRLRAIRYPIDALQFVDNGGKVYYDMPIERIRDALGGNYVYLRRPDLERILAERAAAAGVEIRYDRSLARIDQHDDAVHVRYEDRSEDQFALVIGADGVHSRVRRLVFGLEHEFARFLGYYVAAFHIQGRDYDIGHAAKLHEETDRLAFIYPLDSKRVDATYVFRHPAIDVPSDRLLAFVRERFRGAGWIAEDVLNDYPGEQPIFFDTATQIVMPQWHRGRVALIGDACGCLTLLAGQGSHMAMAGGYVLARELERHGDHEAAFAAYQAALKPHVGKKQKEAARFARVFVPSRRSRAWRRRLAIRLLFSAAMIKFGVNFFGARSVLEGYD